jgi:serine/threonine-protein kinase
LALSPGDRLGAYEIVSLLGAGGMGEVYRARDTKLNRDVALKILPEAFTLDGDRIARFRREAQVLAALNHPNIAAIYGFEDSGSTHALVLELVEGPTLAERIANGPLSLDEALAFARQIAEALKAAHEQGIIHRDLKPANIKVRDDATVKVLDFGLAKALESSSLPRMDLANSPTITSPAMMTGVGTILGTAAYMSPEQAKGRPADKRSDIWAFGCVVYEMLTGRRAFEAEDVSDTLANVLKSEPDWAVLPATLTPSVRTLLTLCLTKDRAHRMADVAVAQFLLRDHAAVPRTLAAVGRAPMWRSVSPWLGAALGVVATTLALWAPWRTPLPLVPLRLEVGLGADASVVATQGPAIALSPDGNVLAFVGEQTAGGSGASRLYVRRLDQLKASPLVGTENARNPFFSPDGKWIAFSPRSGSDFVLKKISITGDTAVTLCETLNSGTAGSWAEDGTIFFSSYRTAGSPVFRVSSSGGKPEPVTQTAEAESVRRWPQALLGGKAVLYTRNSSETNFDEASIVVQRLPDGAPKVVVRGGLQGRYLASGHLVYLHGGTLFAVRFDLDRLDVSGPPVVALEGVGENSNGVAAGGQFAVSATGTLAYLSAQSLADTVPIAWMDRDGKTTAARSTPANWSNLVIAPDGHRFALEVSDGRRRDVWTYEWERDIMARVTFDGTSGKPVWTPDGRRIVFRSTQGGTSAENLFWKRADGTGDIQRLTDSQYGETAWSWHPSGKLLAFHENNPKTKDDVMILAIDGDEASGWKPGKPTVFANGPYQERDPMFSPDGRWLAYQSTESGQYEVYVRPFPGPGSQWRISTGGGTTPTWSRVRHELLYAAPDNRIMIASYTVQGDAFRAEKPTVFSEGHFVPRQGSGGGPTRSFDLHPDGSRIALAPAAQNDAKQDKVVFVFNFFDELHRLAPIKK